MPAGGGGGQASQCLEPGWSAWGHWAPVLLKSEGNTYLVGILRSQCLSFFSSVQTFEASRMKIIEKRLEYPILLFESDLIRVLTGLSHLGYFYTIDHFKTLSLSCQGNSL